MKLKLFFGLWGVRTDRACQHLSRRARSVLISPSGRFEIKLPLRVAAKIQSFLHSISYTGMIGTVYIKDVLGIRHSH